MERLQEGGRVCIVGGGPAGSFAALHLLHRARQSGLRLEVCIFEPRDFRKPGPAGCNRCAGILSSRLVRGLEALGLRLPAEVIQAELHTYALHLDGEILRVHQPDPRRRILSVYRGGGPKQQTGAAPPASFDAWLLEQAVSRGARHIPRRAHRVTRQGGFPTVHTRREHYRADFLVLATGVNSRPPLDETFGYRPPRTAVMAQDEILMPAAWQPGEVRAYFRTPAWLTFGAMIPKGRYLNISLLGRDIPPKGVAQFLESITPPRSLLPQGAVRLCGCAPRIATHPARGYYGDRWAAVGDAAVTRLYKDGIGSAFYTARAAAHTILTWGVSRPALARRYAPCCRRIARDNLYGRALFRLWHITLHSPLLLRAWMRALRREAALPREERIHERILWGMFTGDEPYRRLFRLALSPRAVGRILSGMLPRRR